MNTRKLGSTGPVVSAIGLVGMSDFYGSGHNELLIAKALKDRDRDCVTLSVMFGAMRDPDRRASRDRPAGAGARYSEHGMASLDSERAA
jgi:aryl-alcohol dehydrogenase-like predicted oxidoreductase